MSNKKTEDSSECVVPTHPVPAEVLGRYTQDHDEHSERDIAEYVESQARDETIQHVERIKKEVVLGGVYEMWDVTTDKDRWWVITNLTNLYSQKHFPSLDYTLSFHIGLMMRIREGSESIDNKEPSPFDDVFRRQDQAQKRHDHATEPEDYQSVGMLLREGLISLVAALRRRTTVPAGTELPQDANFVAWVQILVSVLCAGSSNKEIRLYLNSAAKSTWQLVNWLTHARNATSSASSISLHACDTIIGHLVTALQRDRTDKAETCPRCSSRQVRSFYDISIPPDGDYYLSCGVCGWSSHPSDA